MVSKKLGVLAILLSGTCLCAPSFASDLAEYYSGAPETWVNVKEATRYYDMETGKEVAAQDRVEGKEYKEVVIKSGTANANKANLVWESDYLKNLSSKSTDDKYNVGLDQNGDLVLEYAGYGDAVTDYSFRGYNHSRYTIKDDERYFNDLSYFWVGKYGSTTGGALYVDGTNSRKPATVTSLKTLFANNEVSSYDTSSGLGGAIYNNKGSIGDIESTFIGNKAISTAEKGAEGGAIANKGDIKSIAGNFYRNKTDYRGGAISNLSGGLINNIDAVFVENESVAGGAIHGSKGTFDKIQGTYVGNKATGTSSAGGGAIKLDSGYVSSVNGTYVDNESNLHGGAIYITKTEKYVADTAEDEVGEDNTITISGTYAGNKATKDGGAVYLSDVTNALDLSGTYVENKAETSNGGAIKLSGVTAGKISGDFSGNESGQYGGAISVSSSSNNNTDLKSLVGTFYGNKAGKDGGAISVDGAGKTSIESFINSVFVENEAKGYGGAVRFNGGTIDLLDNVAFLNNTAEQRAGALYVQSEITDMANNLFVGNTAKDGGAIASDSNGSIGTLDKSVFQGNTATTGKGGALYINGTIDSLTNSLFAENTAGNNGGAVAVTGKVGHLDEGVFHNNSATEKGGALSVSGALTKLTNVQFVENTAGTEGGAVANSGTIGAIENVLFEKNAVVAAGESGAKGGALAFLGSGTEQGAIKETLFKGNSVTSESGKAQGGALYIHENVGVEQLVNANFIDNSVVGAEGSNGGAIYSHSDLTIVADGKTSLFSGNMVNGESNAIFIKADDGEDGSHNETNLNLFTQNNGAIQFDDGIDGKFFNVNINTALEPATLAEGADDEEDLVADSSASFDFNSASKEDIDALSRVVFNDRVDNAQSFNIAANSVVRLGKNVEINTASYNGGEGSVLELDLAVDAANEKVQNGVIKVSGDVEGSSKLIVRSENAQIFRGAEALFMEAPKDDWSTETSFEVARVFGSPYMWKTRETKTGETKGTDWYLVLTEDPNVKDWEGEFPSFDKAVEEVNTPEPTPAPALQYAPEVAAFAGVQSAALAQNRSIAGSVLSGLAYRKSLNCFEESCGVAEALPKRQAWIDVTHENAKIDAPAEMDAKINGTTLGLDMYRDGEHRAGMFGAYRHGKYDLSGKGKYYSPSESDIKSKSYLFGGYYQYSHNDWLMTGTVFAGKQDIDIKTADGIAKADTDAMQYGSSVEIAKRYDVSDYVKVEPSFGLYYTLLDIDTLYDNVGKSAKFDDLHYLEAELGVKVEREVCNDGNTNLLYVKPSVIRTFSNGGKTKISGIDQDVKSYKDATLGRVEVGGQFGFNESWSGYANTGYTFGEDYESYDFTLGVGYKF